MKMYSKHTPPRKKRKSICHYIKKEKKKSLRQIIIFAYWWDESLIKFALPQTISFFFLIKNFTAQFYT